MGRNIGLAEGQGYRMVKKKKRDAGDKGEWRRNHLERAGVSSILLLSALGRIGCTSTAGLESESGQFVDGGDVVLPLRLL